MNILVTGAAGFIGYSLSQALLRRGTNVFGIDNLNDYYDVRLKKARLQRVLDNHRFTFLKVNGPTSSFRSRKTMALTIPSHYTPLRRRNELIARAYQATRLKTKR